MAESIENIEQPEVTDEKTDVTEKNEFSSQEAQESMEVADIAPAEAELMEPAPTVEDEPEVPKISITLKTAQDQRVVTIAAEAADIKRLKTAAVSEFGVSAERLCFIHFGKVLQDDELLSDNGIEDGSTLPLVIKSHIQVDGKQSYSDQTSEPRLVYDPMLFASVGLESLNYGQLQQHMQRQMLANPELIQQMVQNPLVLQLMENPGVIVEMISSNPQTRDWLKRNPELAEMLHNKDIMQQSLEFAKNPELLKGLVEGQGQGRMQFVGASTSGHGKFSASLPELQTIWHQMAQKPQILQQLYNAPYMKPFLETLSTNPQLAQQMVANPKLFANNPVIQQQMQQMMPYYLQQLQDPQLKSMVTNPKAMQAMIKIQRGLDLLQQEAPNLVSSLGLPNLSMPPQLATFTPVSSSDIPTPPEAGTEDAMSTVLSQMITQIASGQISKSPEERFKDQLEHLTAMGFTDQQTNLQVLTATFGDLGAAVEHLNRQQS